MVKECQSNVSFSLIPIIRDVSNGGGGEGSGKMLGEMSGKKKSCKEEVRGKTRSKGFCTYTGDA